MFLQLPEDSVPVKEMFERFFAAESTPARVRAAEPANFDPALWASLLELDAPFLRVAEEAGGSGLGLFDACVMMEEAGRRLASAPLAENIVALRLLGEVGGEEARAWLDKVRGGEAMLAMALHPARDGERQLVPGAAVADGVLVCDGEGLAIELPASPPEALSTLAGSATAWFVPGSGKRIPVAGNADAVALWRAAVEEWKVLTASALVGLAQEVLKMASEYATERMAFGIPIGANQAISHPLAVDAIEADGTRMLVWWTLRALADGDEEAGALVPMLFARASAMASASVAHAIHTFGGYGLSNEYDVQLYHRRAKSWPLAWGDPVEDLAVAGRRLWLGEEAVLPDAGPVEIDFSAKIAPHPAADETRAIFDRVLDPDKHMLEEQSFEAHDWEVHRALGEAGLLFPEWPEKWGGRGLDAEAARACRAVWAEVGYAGLPRGVTGMAGAITQRFGTPELQDEVLRAFASGQKTSCLGFTEPSGGSDVFAAKTRAVRDGDEWVINGQKMFTSGAELASYVLLLTRTNTEVPKHKGLTVFLCPLDVPGVEIQPVHTFMDERTNATFYADVRIPDRYRLGDVDAGVKVMSASLSMEQGGSQYHHQINKMIAAVVEHARKTARGGRPMIEDPAVLSRLARIRTDSIMGQALAARVAYVRRAGLEDLAFGPASKIFTTQAFIDDSADLLDLAAPESLIRSKEGLGVVEKGYRHATATSIYGGTSEVLRSMVAERRLGLPRSRA